MKDLKTLFEETQATLYRYSLSNELPIENRAFIQVMLVFTEEFITRHEERFEAVFEESLQLEEAKLN